MTESQPMQVFVTGAGGFIGTAVVLKLIQLGVSVNALLGPPGSTFSPFAHVKCGFAEIDDLPALIELAGVADTVIHMAGPPSVAASFIHPAEYARTHGVGTATILELCRTIGVRRLVYISSAEVYGRPHINPVKENFPTSPRSPYGAVKLGCEAYIYACAEAFGLEAVILRPFSVYGPGGPERSVLGTIIRQALHQREITIQNLNPVRDYCFVHDVADAIWLSCHRSLPELISTYNIGTGIGTSVNQLIQYVLEHLELELPVNVITQRDRPAGNDLLELIADPICALHQLEWRAKTSLKEGIKKTIKFLEANPNRL